MMGSYGSELGFRRAHVSSVKDGSVKQRTELAVYGVGQLGYHTALKREGDEAEVGQDVSDDSLIVPGKPQ